MFIQYIFNYNLTLLAKNYMAWKTPSSLSRLWKSTLAKFIIAVYISACTTEFLGTHHPV